MNSHLSRLFIACSMLQDWAHNALTQDTNTRAFMPISEPMIVLHGRRHTA